MCHFIRFADINITFEAFWGSPDIKFTFCVGSVLSYIVHYCYEGEFWMRTHVLHDGSANIVNQRSHGM